MVQKFKTQYHEHDRVPSKSGDPIKTLYTGFYNELGQVELKEDGKENLYDYIQSFKDSTDINLIVKRFASGEVDVLEKVQGYYGDVTQMPTTYPEMLQRIHDAENVFNSLPVEVRAEFGHNFREFLSASNDPDFMDRLGIKQKEPIVTPPPVEVPALPPVEVTKEVVS